jgi:acyl phosphate:glycerol-3-phosphate acyltransferase
MIPLFLSVLIGYLFGSIPFGLILTKLAGLGDIRAIGSGNIGATNVLRTGNKLLAFLTLLLDGGKGAAAILLGTYIITHFYQDIDFYQVVWIPLLLGFSAIIGHCYPVWLKFKGGKGVATALGTLLMLNFTVGALACLTWLLVAVISRYSSLSALVAIALTPLTSYFFDSIEMVLVCVVIAALVFYKHRANIQRLSKGEEPKIGKKN